MKSVNSGITMKLEGIEIKNDAYRVHIETNAKFKNWIVRHARLGAPDGEALFTLNLPSHGRRSRKRHKTIEDFDREARIQLLQFCEEIVKHLTSSISSL
jgi:hypothetical protein